MPLDILFEDDNLIAVNKPSGLVVNRSHTTVDETLQDIMAATYPNLFASAPVAEKLAVDYESLTEEEYESVSKQDFYSRNGIVHRIDKDTSGVLLIAKNPDVFFDMQKLFKNRLVAKTYRAICFGKAKEDFIEVEAPLVRNPKFTFKYAVSPKGKDAVTLLEKKRQFVLDNTDLTEYEIKPKTGRTHQIRVHLAAMNQAIVYDTIYDTKKQFEWSQTHFRRLMLHASSISFEHPVTKTTLTVEAKLPEEFKIYS